MVTEESCSDKVSSWMYSTSLMVTIFRIVLTAMMIKEIAVPRPVDHILSEKYAPQIAVGSILLILYKSKLGGS